MKIFIAADHAGYEMKESLKEFLQLAGHDVEDLGAHQYDEPDDYPDFIIPAAQKVAATADSMGIVLGGSGQGEAIAANKVDGIRAALYYGHNMEIVRLSRTHNNANVLSLGARMISLEEAKEAVSIWLETKFNGEERHQRRTDKMLKYEQERS